MRLLHSHAFNNSTIECDDIDGVVFGSWANVIVNENPSVRMVDEDSAYAGYWACAAVWFSFYDQRTIERVSQSSYFCVHIHIVRYRYFKLVFVKVLHVLKLKCNIRSIEFVVGI